MANLLSSYGATERKSSADSASVASVSVRAGASESQDSLPDRRQIGLVSAIFIIFNRIIGTG